MFRQDRTNPSSAVSNWKGRKDTAKAWPSTAVSSWLNGALFSGGGEAYNVYWVGGTNTNDGYANATGTVALTSDITSPTWNDANNILTNSVFN